MFFWAVGLCSVLEFNKFNNESSKIISVSIRDVTSVPVLTTSLFDWVIYLTDALVAYGSVPTAGAKPEE